MKREARDLGIRISSDLRFEPLQSVEFFPSIRLSPNKNYQTNPFRILFPPYQSTTYGAVRHTKKKNEPIFATAVRLSRRGRRRTTPSCPIVANRAARGVPVHWKGCKSERYENCNLTPWRRVVSFLAPFQRE